MKKLLLLLIIPTICFFSCKEDDVQNFNANSYLIHHQVIIDNNDSLQGSFYLYTNAGHSYYLNPSDTMAIINGVFGAPLKDWHLGEGPYTVMFYYIGNGFGCADIEINTFVDFELYHSTNFNVGKINDQVFCAWNENSFQYPIWIQ